MLKVLGAATHKNLFLVLGLLGLLSLAGLFALSNIEIRMELNITRTRGKPAVQLEGRDSQKRAIVTIVATDSHLIGARVLGRSITRFGTRVESRVLIMPEEMRGLPYLDQIQKDGDWTKQIFLPFGSLLPSNPYVDNSSSRVCPGHYIIEDNAKGSPLYKAKFSSVFSKLLIWNLEEYEKVAYFDTDIVFHESPDSLFECPSLLCAPPIMDSPGGHRYKSFSSGILIAKPSKSIFGNMMDALSQCQLPSYDSGDQGFLNSVFRCYNYPNFSKPFNPKEDCPSCIGRSSCDLSKNTFKEGSKTQLESVGTISVDHFSADSYSDLPWQFNAVPMDPLFSFNHTLSFRGTHFSYLWLKPWIWFLLPAFPRYWQWVWIRLELEIFEPNFLVQIFFLILLVLLIRQFSQTRTFERLVPMRCRCHLIIFPLFWLVAGAFIFFALFMAFPWQVSPLIAWPLFHILHSLIYTRLVDLFPRLGFSSLVRSAFFGVVFLWTPTLTSTFLKLDRNLSIAVDLFILLSLAWFWREPSVSSSQTQKDDTTV